MIGGIQAGVGGYKVVAMVFIEKFSHYMKWSTSSPWQIYAHMVLKTALYLNFEASTMASWSLRARIKLSRLQKEKVKYSNYQSLFSVYLPASSAYVP